MSYVDDLLFLVEKYTGYTNSSGWIVDLDAPVRTRSFWVLKQVSYVDNGNDRFYLPVLDDGYMSREDAARLAQLYIKGERLPLWD